MKINPLKDVMMVDVKHREFAENALRHMFIGSQLDGVRFGVGAGAILIRFMHNINRDPDDLWLNIESTWTVLPFGTTDYPTCEGDMPELTEEEQYDLVFKLRREKVVDIGLGEIAPHLRIVFESGDTLFVNGHHEKYECWQAGDGAGYTGNEWFIVAVPGDGITYVAPDDFQKHDR